MDDKARRILAAAVTVFSENGFDDAKVDDIAQLAEVGKGTVYQYFDSKQDLFDTMLKEGMVSYIRLLQDALADGATLEESFQKAILTSLQFMNDKRALAQVVMDHQTGGKREAIRSWIITLREDGITAIRQTIEKHLNTSDRPNSVDSTLAAHIFLGAVNALSTDRLLDAEGCSTDNLISHGEDLEAFAAEAARLLTHGIDPQ